MDEKPREAPLHDRDALLRQGMERLVRSYSTYYETERNREMLGATIPALLYFHSRSEKYVYSEVARNWDADTEEYVALFAVERLDLPEAERLLALAEAMEGELVNPREEHMYTHLTVIVLTHRIDPAAAQRVRRHRYRKSSLRSFRGWSAVRFCALEMGPYRTVCNRDGRAVERHVHKVIGPYIKLV